MHTQKSEIKRFDAIDARKQGTGCTDLGVLPGSSRRLPIWKTANMNGRTDGRPCRKAADFPTK
jgi:hypothetical protein